MRKGPVKEKTECAISHKEEVALQKENIKLLVDKIDDIKALYAIYSDVLYRGLAK